MSNRSAQGTSRELQDLQEALVALLVANKGKKERIRPIHTAYQAADHMEAHVPGHANTEMISAFEDLVQTNNQSAFDTPDTLNKRGVTYFGRFQRFGNLNDLEVAITCWQRAVEFTTDDDYNRPGYLSNVGVAYQMRFARLGSLADLEAGISTLRMAINLVPDDHPNKPANLSNLGAALHVRFGRFGSLVDLEEGILMKQMAVKLTPDNHPNKPPYLDNLGGARMMRFHRLGLLADLEDAISNTRKAIELMPDHWPSMPLYLTNLGGEIQERFERLGSLVDLEEAISTLRAAIRLVPDDHPNKPQNLTRLGAALQARFERLGSLADLEEAVLMSRMAVKLTPDDHPGKASRLNTLGSALDKRFVRNRTPADFEEAILMMRMALDLTPNDDPSKAGALSNLGVIQSKYFDLFDSPGDLEEAISNLRKAVNLTPDDDPIKPTRLNNFGKTLMRRFVRFGSPTDLEDSILHSQMAVDLIPDGHTIRTVCLYNLGNGLITRFGAVGEKADLQKALLVAKEAAESTAGSSLWRLRGALVWAKCSALASTSPLPAFDCAINLLPSIAWLGLAVDDQYELLSEAGVTSRDAVAAAIAEGEDELALTWAEQGRSIVWQNLLSLRTPLDSLQSQYPELAKRLREVSQHLERPVEPRNASDAPQPISSADIHRALAMERGRLIDEVRTKPGFGRFMKPKSLEELAPAARDGPVIFLNLGGRRCDALALLPDEDGSAYVVSIPLTQVTPQSAKQLSDRLVKLLASTGVRARESRKFKSTAKIVDKNAVFKEILQTLWLDYVKPVIDGLAFQVNLESPPRLWWCTTGPLAFLPLHAAGLYDIKENGHKLSDYVVSSYTPSLTALLDQSSPISSNDLGILTVSISNTPGAPLPSTEKEVETLRSFGANLPVVSLMNEDATQERVLKELEKSAWVHLACHGEQVSGKPMESGLILHDRKLKLSEIVKANLPKADLAFLSACQTAVGEEGVPEESAHLAAGMLFAGYRGVVATMWSIQDEIAPRVAEDFYRHMFRNGQPSREEAAHALHKALRSLQESGAHFISWVPFIHLGR